MSEPLDYGAILEAEDRTLAAKEESLAQEREEWLLDARRYVERLRRLNLPLPSFAERLEQGGRTPPLHTAADQPDAKMPVYDGISYLRVVNAKPRIGEQRGTILKCIAKATQEGQEVTPREVANEIGVDYTRVINVIWQDENRGLLTYTSKGRPKMGAPKKVKMTDLGFDVLKRAGLLDDNPPKE